MNEPCSKCGHIRNPRKKEDTEKAECNIELLRKGDKYEANPLYSEGIEIVLIDLKNKETGEERRVGINEFNNAIQGAIENQEKKP